MSLVGGVLAGGALGVTHALEADHLAAVTTLVDDADSRSAAAVGASWGIGHAVPIVVLGLLFVLLDVTIPQALTSAVEVLVGLVLIALGLRMLATLASGVAVDGHDHGGEGHHHLRLGTLSLGLTHSHRHGEAALVGVLHGIAGSGALVVALVATRSTPADALSLLLGFVVLSISTMAVVSLLWGRTLGTRLRRPLRSLAGAVAILVGVVLVADVLALG